MFAKVPVDVFYDAAYLFFERILQGYFLQHSYHGVFSPFDHLGIVVTLAEDGDYVLHKHNFISVGRVLLQERIVGFQFVGQARHVMESVN